MSFRYHERDLTLVEGHFGKRYFVDFADIIQNDMYFGDVLSVPIQIKRNGQNITLIEFKKETVFPKTAKVIEASKNLKEKLKFIKAEIDNKMQTQSDPNIKQAQLIFNTFEERWLEPDNIYFNNDRTYIWRWGIRPAAIGEFVPFDGKEIKENMYQRVVKDTPIQKANSKGSNFYFYAYILIVLFAFLLYYFIN